MIPILLATLSMVMPFSFITSLALRVDIKDIFNM
nr:MAG TPA: hypothetical protein [Caudoviricetes sp.]